MRSHKVHISKKMKCHSDDEGLSSSLPDEQTKLISSSPSSSSYNVRSMLVHSPYIPAKTTGTAKTNRNSGSKGAILKKKQLSKNKTRKKISLYRRAKQEGGDYYGSWKGRVSVHTDVEEFDLKLLEQNVIGKSDIVTEKGWKMEAFYNVIQLWLPPTSSSKTLPISILTSFEESSTNVPTMGLENFFNESEQLKLSSMDDYNERPKQQDILNHESHESEINAEEGASTPEIYIFSFGAVVFWNFESDESEILWMKQNLFDPLNHI